MNLYSIIDKIRNASVQHKLVNEFNEGDIYELLNSGEHKYPAVILTVQSTNDIDDLNSQVSFNLFCLDRLEDDKFKNEVFVQSTCETTLRQIVAKLEEDYAITFNSKQYTFFSEKFADLCAGAYLTANVSYSNDILCSESTFEVKTKQITSNGEHNVAGYDFANVNVTGTTGVGRLCEKIVKTNNCYYIINPKEGSYTDCDYFTGVRILTEIPTSSTTTATASITTNGSYVYKPSDYSADTFTQVTVNVNVPTGETPTSTRLTVEKTENGTYSFSPSDYGVDYFSGVTFTVNVPEPHVDRLDSVVIANKSTFEFYPETYGLDYFSSLRLYTDIPVPESSVTLTQAEYDALSAKSNTTLYVIVDSGTTNVESIYWSSNLLWQKPTNVLRLVATENNSVVKMIKNGTANPNLKYKINNGSWTNWGEESAYVLLPINLNSGDTVYFVGNNEDSGLSQSWINYCQFAITGSVEAYGSVMSLVDGAGNSLTIPNDYCFLGLFKGCTGLKKAPELPATTLTNGCYREMFYGCTGLTEVPVILPATSLAEGCYWQMFFNCKSLTTAPELPATELNDFCYGNMFYGCTNLNNVKCLATDITAEDCTDSWLYDVAEEGTFTKASGMTGWTTGDSGIPSGWTIEE